MRKLWLVCLPISLAACTGDDPSVGSTSSGDTDTDTDGGTDGTTGSTDSDTDSAGTDSGTGGGSCGDGVLDANEECDDGDQNADTAACKSDCTTNVCGDGDVLEGTEECDDGNTEDLDDCSNTCVAAVCGDGELQGAEECDDGGDNADTAACKSDCTSNVCGDGAVLEGTEECDDGNMDEDDSCSNACVQLPFCGDGVSVPTELCYADPVLVDTKAAPNEVQIADISNDGVLDVLVTQGTANEVRILLNDGAGMLTASGDIATGGMGSEDLAVGDFDGDGVADFAVVTSTSDKTVLFYGTQANVGDPVTFAAPSDLAATGAVPHGIDARDLNGDDRVDLVISEFGATGNCYQTGVYLGQMNDSMNLVSVALGGCDQLLGGGQDVVIGDFRGAGAGNPFQFVTARTGITQLDLHQDFSQMSLGTTEMPIGIANEPRKMSVGQLNADALDDLIVPIWNSAGCDYENDINVCDGDEVWLYIGDANDVVFDTPFVVEVGAKGAVATAVGDVTADGVADVALVSQWDDKLTVLTNDSLGNLVEAPAYDTTGTQPVAVAVGDLNGDSVADIVTANLGSSNISVFLSNP